MFYCDDCAEKNGYPQSIIRSIGPCECCGKVADCSDMPSSNLPKSEEKLDEHIEVGLLICGSPAEGIPVNIDFLNETIKNEIEKIAWQIFVNRLELRFIRKLTVEEKKSITDNESFVYYRELAEKVYAKRQRAVFNKKYPAIEIPSDGKRGMNGGAYCLCFVYSKYKGNFVLKGHMREVKEYLKKNYTHYFCNYSMWNGGQNRDSWYFWKKEIAIFDVSIKERKKGKKTQVRPWREYVEDEAEIEAKTLTFRRLPKRWIKEFDTL